MGVERWQEHHPEAAAELGNWVRAHPNSASRFFEWDGHHPERAKAFVTWAITHPGEGIEAFTVTHRSERWEEFEEIMLHHRVAADQFIAWCRRHARASEALMNHPHGLEWVGHHLYNEYWTPGGAVAVAVAAPAPVVDAIDGPEVGIELWKDHHPEAARELGEWIRAHHGSARFFFEWDGHHPERAKGFVMWAIRHPGEGIEAFSASHANERWEQFEDIMLHHRVAADQFMAWCRRHPRAAESLMNHPRGLEWAGHHLFRDAWEMEGR
jgi:hypothetical protein